MSLDETQKDVSSNTTLASPKKKQVRNIPVLFLSIALALWALWVLSTLLHLTDLMVSRYTRCIGRRASRRNGEDSDEEEVSQRTPLLKKSDGKVDKKVRFDVENTTVWKFDDGEDRI
ncbi:hypothetical protein DER45DRAFT_616997 [Fusarium avenaceum]|nr:hypothetical protein DER45DRAFT_616997 [Fusarium avenaceum]